MRDEIEKNKRYAISQLEEGLERSCADDITAVLVNMEDGTCDYLELIPLLERVANRDSFYYFDDNGAGGMPHADHNRKTSFKAWALRAIENIKENARLESMSELAEVLKCNDVDLIQHALIFLKNEGDCADESLIPILEKIARKNEYQSYSYYSGFKTDCKLGELAENVIQIIRRNSVSPIEKDRSVSENDENFKRCFLCVSLPDDLTVNTGRDECFPPAFRNLTEMDREYDAEFRRCPACGIYFNWIDLPQMYGTGNNAEERLVRLSKGKSILLDKIFSSDAADHPQSDEVDEYFKALPVDLLVAALKSRAYSRPEIVAPFVPGLLGKLIKNNDTALWELLRTYVSDRPERARNVLDSFRASADWGKTRLSQILHQCLKVTAEKKAQDQ
jgi:hypothetical protein